MCSSPLSSPPFQEVASHFSDWPFAPHDARGRVGRRSAARCIWKVKSLSIDADSEVVCIRQLFLLPMNKKTEGSLSIIFMQSSIKKQKDHRADHSLAEKSKTCWGWRHRQWCSRWRRRRTGTKSPRQRCPRTLNKKWLSPVSFSWSVTSAGWWEKIDRGTTNPVI